MWFMSLAWAGEEEDGHRTPTPTPSGTATVTPSPSEQRSRGQGRLGRDSTTSRSTTPAPDSPTKDTHGRPAWADAFAEGEVGLFSRAEHSLTL